MDFKDLMAGLDHVIGLGIAGQNRLGVMGWSYGGFLASTITQTQLFRAAQSAPVQPTSHYYRRTPCNLLPPGVSLITD